MEVGFTEFASESLASYATLGYLQKRGGEGEAAGERRRAVEAYLAAADRGKEIALSGVRGFGAGMDPETYRVHAYEKGMMILSMVEDAIGREAMDRLLAGFFEANRGQRIGWADLRAALVKGGSAARNVVRQWEEPGVPALGLEHEIKRSGRRWKVAGTLSQEGGTPSKMEVPVVFRGGGKTETVDVRLTGGKARLSHSLDFEPEEVLVDPEYRLLVRAPRGGPVDLDQLVEAALEVANSPNETDRAKNEEAVAKLRRALAAGAGRYEGVCHIGIGRCLFRLGKHDEARKELETALTLGAGGPFHRAWAHLRLGCIADVRKDRKKAVEHYEAVVNGRGASKYTVDLARRFLKEPYRAR
jgi:tetratricopeptide (TPR) repeat protein